jgi:hypothetical protein
VTLSTTLELTFRWTLPAAAAAGMPRGEVEIDITQTPRGWSGVAYVSLGRRLVGGVDNEEFDGGAIVVDRRRTGEVAGVEFMRVADWDSVPQFARRAAGDAQEQRMLRVVFATAMEAWSAVLFALAIADVGAPAGSPPRPGDDLGRLQRRLLDARPDLRRWQTRARTTGTPLPV